MRLRTSRQPASRACTLDIMDGHFVPNLSYGLPVVETVRRLTRLPIETHLMISEPEKYVERYIDAGADLVTIHFEATKNPTAVLRQIRGHGAAAGLGPQSRYAAVGDRVLPAGLRHRVGDERESGIRRPGL